jgi:hypothetical protein
MNKLIMAFTLLLASFFSQFFIAFDLLAFDIVSPEEIDLVTGTCSYPSYATTTKSACLSTVKQAMLIERAENSSHTKPTNFRFVYVSDDIESIVFSYNTKLEGDPDFNPETVDVTVASFSYPTTTTTTSCPNPSFPDHVYSVSSDDNSSAGPDGCSNVNPNLEQCPQGNYKYKLAGGCVPIECDDSGSQSTMWASGGTYNNTTGTYCDGSCAHSVSGGQNSDGYSGNIGLTGVSTGEICGQGGIEDRWHNEGTGVDCVSQNGFLSCPNGDTPDTPPDTEPTVNLEPEKVTLEEITPLIPVKETCVTGDSSCEIRNLKETIVTKGLEQKEIDLLLHNKKIAADKKTSTKIIDGINDSTGRNLQGLEILTGAVNGLKDSIGTGGGSSTGNGFGDGDVTCDGDDCEGDVLTDIEPSAGLEGYWESEYEDGLEGMFLGKLEEYKQTEFFLFLEQFKPQISGGSAPNYNWCFNFGQYMNLGCHNLSIDPRVFPALKIFILISAAFACRAILFGG